MSDFSIQSDYFSVFLVKLKAEKPPPSEEGEAPRFIIPLSDSTVFTGSPIELECKVTGKPLPTVKWTKDGHPLAEDARFDWSESRPDEGFYRLRIRDATAHDEGTYRCVATNESGQASTRATVRVEDELGVNDLPINK